LIDGSSFGFSLAASSAGLDLATIGSLRAPRATFCLSTLVLYSARNRAFSGSFSSLGLAVSTTCCCSCCGGGGGGGGWGAVTAADGCGAFSGGGGSGLVSRNISSSSFSGSIGLTRSNAF
jgi:hypothetical protein